MASSLKNLKAVKAAREGGPATTGMRDGSGGLGKGKPIGGKAVAAAALLAVAGYAGWRLWNVDPAASIAAAVGVETKTVQAAIDKAKQAAPQVAAKVEAARERLDGIKDAGIAGAAAEIKGKAAAKVEGVKQRLAERNAENRAREDEEVADGKAAVSASQRGGGRLLAMFSPVTSASPDRHRHGRVKTVWTQVGVSAGAAATPGTDIKAAFAASLVHRAAGGVPPGFQVGRFTPGGFGAGYGTAAIGACLDAGLTCAYFPHLFAESSSMKGGGQDKPEEDFVLGIPSPSADPSSSPASPEALERSVVRRVAGDAGTLESAVWLSPDKSLVLVQTASVTFPGLSILAACREDECRPFAMLPIREFAPAQRIIEISPGVGQLGGLFAVANDETTGPAAGYLSSRQWLQMVLRGLEVSSSNAGWRLASELDRISSARPDAAAMLASGGTDLKSAFSAAMRELASDYTLWNWSPDLVTKGLDDPNKPLLVKPLRTVGAGIYRLDWEFHPERMPSRAYVQMPPIIGSLTYRVKPMGPGAYVELADEEIAPIALDEIKLYVR